MEDLEIESFTPGAGLMATELKQEDIASPLSEDHKTEEKDSSHEITLSPETEKFEEKKQHDHHHQHVKILTATYL